MCYHCVWAIKSSFNKLIFLFIKQSEHYPLKATIDAFLKCSYRLLLQNNKPFWDMMWMHIDNTQPIEWIYTIFLFYFYFLLCLDCPSLIKQKLRVFVYWITSNCSIIKWTWKIAHKVIAHYFFERALLISYRNRTYSVA